MQVLLAGRLAKKGGRVTMVRVGIVPQLLRASPWNLSKMSEVETSRKITPTQFDKRLDYMTNFITRVPNL